MDSILCWSNGWQPGRKGHPPPRYGMAEMLRRQAILQTTVLQTLLHFLMCQHTQLLRTIFQARRQNARMVVRDRCLEKRNLNLAMSLWNCVHDLQTSGRYMSFNFHGSTSNREQTTGGHGQGELELGALLLQ